MEKCFINALMCNLYYVFCAAAVCCSQICTKNKEPFLRKLHNSIMEKASIFFPAFFCALDENERDGNSDATVNNEITKGNIIKCIIFYTNNLSCQSILNIFAETMYRILSLLFSIHCPLLDSVNN